MKKFGVSVYLEEELLKSWKENEGQKTEVFNKVIDSLAAKLKENPEEHINFYLNEEDNEIEFMVEVGDGKESFEPFINNL